MSKSILSENWIQHPIYQDYYFSDDGRAMSNKKGKYKELKGTKCGQQAYRAIAVDGAKKFTFIVQFANFSTGRNLMVISVVIWMGTNITTRQTT